MYLTTETNGLWYISTLRSPTPTFSLVEGYPFRQPERVFFNPYKPDELWVTSFGAGMMVGTNGPSGVKQPPGQAPAVFELQQNYPNPFNPSTTIQYTLTGVGRQASGVSEVRMMIYDVLGREVAVLADGKYPSGKYEFTFDGRGLASGVYFYRLTAGQKSAVRIMTLVK